jgi:hypothetical protein
MLMCKPVSEIFDVADLGENVGQKLDCWFRGAFGLHDPLYVVPRCFEPH